MPLAKNVEKRIWDTEGFAVVIRHGDGRDMRGDRQGLPPYPYTYSAKNSMTVATWVEQRFNKVYPGFRVDVLDGSAEPANGQTLLSTIRDSYIED
jgi:hypothetical protein